MMIVLTSLLVAMTVTSAVLLLLEPQPITPATDLTLRAVDHTTSTRNIIFQTDPPADPRRWEAIVIHDSGTLGGSSRSLGREHDRDGRGGLGYHFVIGNGNGTEDGQIEVGFRWQRQMMGMHSAGEGSDWLNRRAIAICLINDGDRQAYTPAQMQRLLWLVHELQRQFEIPPEAVYLDMQRQWGTGVGRLFPSSFRSQLLSPTATMP